MSEFELKKLYGNEHILEIKTDLISIDIHFNKIEVKDGSLFLYRTDVNDLYQSFSAYLYKIGNKEVIETIVEYAKRNMIQPIEKGE